MGDAPDRAEKAWQSTSVTIPGSAPISLTLRPKVRESFDRARFRARAANRSDWAEHVILAATEGLYEGTVHERLRAAAEAFDLPERTLLRLWLLASSDEAIARSIAQARAHQVDREK